MKKLFTTFSCLLVFGVLAIAQIPNDSPFPVDSEFAGPDNFFRVFEYGSMADFGDTLDATVSGQLVWAYDDMNDSLMCNPGSANLEGKIALIRRGACNFSLKIWNAQDQGAAGVVIVDHTPIADGGGLVNMAGGDSAALVNIPAIFITWDDGEIIREKLDAGEEIITTFRIRSFFGGLGFYHYHTPQSQVRPMDQIAVSFLNLDQDNPVDVDLSVTITDPSGGTESYTESGTIDPATIAQAIFEETYIPEEIGEYTMSFSNSINSETVEQKFAITNGVFAHDNDNIVDWISQSDQGFIDDGLRYDYGNFYYTGAEAETAVSMTFALENAGAIFTGDPDSDVFQIRVYDADPDGDGVVPNAVTYDELNPNGDAVIVGFADYVLTGSEQPYEMITVDFEDPIDLNPNSIYLLMVQYDGLNAAVGIPPHYAYAGTDDVIGAGSAVFSDQLYTGGWNGGFKSVSRLNLDGFSPIGAVSTSEPTLDASKVTINPNPTSTNLNVSLDLAQNADLVEVALLDIMGQVIRIEERANIQKGNIELNVADFPMGTYFVSINTPEGHRTMKFVVTK